METLDELLSMDHLQLQEKFRRNEHLREDVLDALLRRLSLLLIREPNLLELRSPISVCGDIHGQLLDLFKLFHESGQDIPNHRFLFLGDYVDRGHSSIATFAYLAFLKLRFPKNIFLLRGNHESRKVNQMYGLINECSQLYGHQGLWHLMNNVFDCLPVAAIVDNRIFCVHGGLSPQIKYVESIFTLVRKKEIEDDTIADLTWSDPENVPDFQPNRRGSGQLFGPQQSRQFLHNNRLGTTTGPRDDPRRGFIARSHQLAQDGFAWMHNDDLVIVWSAPNYSYTSGNKAAIMSVDPQKDLRFQVFLQDESSHNKPSDIELSYFV
jgi:diadenosine tetraphosphatase ApaH/serine/threonine PP2A family protein phosphatase